MTVPSSNTHRVVIDYSAQADDGTWLRCECGWELNLDYEPEVERAAAETAKHREASERR